MKKDCMSRSMSAFAIGLGVAFAACAPDDAPQPITYEEFVARATFDPDTGTYATNGDELAENDAQMQLLYDGYLESFADLQAAEAGFGTTRQGLIVWTVNGHDDKWDAPRAARLT